MIDCPLHSTGERFGSRDVWSASPGASRIALSYGFHHSKPWSVVYGSLEPVTVTDPQSHTYLPEVAANAWDAGVDRS